MAFKIPRDGLACAMMSQLSLYTALGRAILCVVYLLAIASNSESVQRSANVGDDSGSSTDLFAFRGDSVTLTYTSRVAAQSVTFGWFLSLGGNSTTLSAVPNAARFSASTSGLTTMLEFDFDASIPDGSSFRPLVTVTTVTNGIPSSSSSFAGSVIVKLGVIPKLQLDRISDVIAEGDPIHISVNVIEGRPDPNVTLLNTTRDHSLILANLTSTLYQIRATSASISDGGVYRIEAINVVGRDSINFTLIVHLLRLHICDLCNANNGSIANCTFTSSPKPTEVKFDNQSPRLVKEGPNNYSVSVMIPGKPRHYRLMISNGYSSPLRVECNQPATTSPPVSTTASTTAGSTPYIAIGCSVGGVAVIVLLLLLLCPIKLSCRQCLQRKCCLCCFKCYDNCCTGSKNEGKKESVPLEDVEEAEPYATSPGAPAAASSKKQEDEVEPYGVSGGAVSATKEEKSKAAPESAPKEEYAKPDMSKKSTKKAAQQAPTGGDVYAQVDKKKKDEKGDVNYAALDHSGSKSATLQSASNEGGVVYSQMQKK
ncbi:uncharacterized protein [Oscarella lobularis]|uniref:uncharacterized protein isoform X2 n=1 Tax=Oscarella lobularis TaxID=121494 RepID=UPI0033138AD7